MRSDSFPSGCCGNASELSERFLISKGFVAVKLIANKWRHGQSHVWLEYEGYIIDIAADQFPEQKGNPIIVVEKHKSNFHSEFISDMSVSANIVGQSRNGKHKK